MKLSAIEKQVVANIHSLPLDKQQSVLEYSLFLIHNVQKEKQENVKSVSAGAALKSFLKKYEADPIDIDTDIFERDREIETDRDIKL